jgi:phosphoglucosamine mutase
LAADAKRGGLVMKKLFGTDGIRAVAGEYPLDAESICILGRALMDLLRDEGLPPRVLIGRDTRESGEWIEDALVQGVQAGDGRSVSAGVIPTSAVSYLAKTRGFSAGIVISASHNPHLDNGIKIFSPAGTKISDVWEERLESEIVKGGPACLSGKTKVRPDPGFLQEYAEFLQSRFNPGKGAAPLKVVLDCANGAASAVAPQVMRSLGFTVHPTFCEPNGRNINHACGSLHPEKLKDAVLQNQADLGIAYDGDADRAVWVDETGRLLNGDHTMLVLGRAMKETGRLRGRTVVATTMSNMGLEKALAVDGLGLVRTQVGDKYVLEKMQAIDANLGGERSGHTILLDECPTGDGLLTSLKILEVMARKHARITELIEGYSEFPQILKNVPVVRKPDLAGIPEVAAAVAEVKRRLGKRGRLDVRYSGTEPLARVMIEGEDAGEIESLAARITRAIEKKIGA